MEKTLTKVVLILTTLLSLSAEVFCFAWKSEKGISGHGGNAVLPAINSPSESSQTAARLSHIYEVALKELEDMESEPLCHRIAARLLVNNCQLLDGKDEASILTDSGRRIRDFVDSYAASLAICDLERGSFNIPSACAQFREPVLAHLPASSDPVLHVTSKQIDSCLVGLATSDSAWNTWISYRHKALRFCEAARADNEKVQSIRLYQRLTKVIGDLVAGTELELQKHMDELDRRTREANRGLNEMESHIQLLQNDLRGLHEYILANLGDAAETSKTMILKGQAEAEHLEATLAAIVRMVSDSSSQIALAHQDSLEQLHRTADDGIDDLIASVALVVASSKTLQNQMEQSRMQADALNRRQYSLEQGILRLEFVSQNLSSRYEDHARALGMASNITDDILCSLQETASSASTIQEAFARDYSRSSWWPYLVCPAVTLVMGSYGLPPSVFRNIGLIALGQIVGLLVDTVDLYKMPTTLLMVNATATANSTDGLLSLPGPTNPGLQMSAVAPLVKSRHLSVPSLHRQIRPRQFNWPDLPFHSLVKQAFPGLALRGRHTLQEWSQQRVQQPSASERSSASDSQRSSPPSQSALHDSPGSSLSLLGDSSSSSFSSGLLLVPSDIGTTITTFPHDNFFWPSTTWTTTTTPATTTPALYNTHLDFSRDSLATPLDFEDPAATGSLPLDWAAFDSMSHYAGLDNVSLFHGAGDVLTVPTSAASTGPSSVAVSAAVPGIVESATCSSASERGSPSDSGLIPGLTFDRNTKPLSRKRTHDSSSASSSHGPDPDASAELALKRQRNNIAAKKYRQKRIDRIAELEDEVDEVKRERDELRIQLARQEAETAALKEMLKMGMGGGGSGGGSPKGGSRVTTDGD